MNEYRKMLRNVQILDFAVHDTALFLDSHANDKDALMYFNHYQQLAKKAKEEFESNFGPLQYQNQHDINDWAWTTGPWPWESEE